jgi:hypothetical protein
MIDADSFNLRSQDMLAKRSEPASVRAQGRVSLM